MSASTSCKDLAIALLAAVRRGEAWPESRILELGESCAADFFREVVEPLADSFDPSQAAAYEKLMRIWIPPVPVVTPVIPNRVDTVYVLSRVTLGADIKIVSPILAAMKLRFPGARIVFVANRKSAELFEADPRIEHLNVDYPRKGPVSLRVDFARELRSILHAENAIVVDPDSRMTQLGMIPVCTAENYFHFPSRSSGADGAENLTDLVRGWLRAIFGLDAPGYIAPLAHTIEGQGPRAAVSLGVGDNESKRIGDGFETSLIDALGLRYKTIWVDRGVGGEEARRVTAAVEASIVADRVRFQEGGFAGFASIISQCDLYAGYDSAGQHAAVAARIPLISVFAGAPSERFRRRWMAAGDSRIGIIVTDGKTAQVVLREFMELMPLD